MKKSDRIKRYFTGANDYAHQVIQRIDGRGIVTNYLYTDAESKLTDIQYPASTSLNVHYVYDTLGLAPSVLHPIRASMGSGEL